MVKQVQLRIQNGSDRSLPERADEQELAELRAALKAANEENKTLKYVMRIIQEEYGESVVKKYLPGLQLKKPLKKTKRSK